MPKIFISYRRLDSQYVADSIHDHMGRYFGEENVFIDVGSIPFGVDFRVYLREQIATHEVVLVIIGPDWGRLMAERADRQDDYVRIEVENALQQGKLVIPVLVMNAELPDFRALPASIRDLQYRSAAVVRRKPDLENDCKRVVASIEKYFAAQPAPPETASSVQPPTPPATSETASASVDACVAPTPPPRPYKPACPNPPHLLNPTPL
jgi:hypothetical protein